VASKCDPLFLNPGSGKYNLDSSLELPPLNVPALLRDYHLSPKKGLGQNFLVDSSALEELVNAAEISPGVAVLEVGPGVGSLTRCLAQVSRRVVAVELDEGLIPLLHKVLSAWNNIEIIQGDIMDLDPARIVGEEGYFVVANIPYYITSMLIRHLLEARTKPGRLVLTVQREVAERICAMPGDLSLLALSVQVYGSAKQVLRIPAGSFYPIPKVDSTAVRVDLFSQPAIPAERLNLFFRLAKAGFSQKRKTLRNALSAGLHLPAEKIENIIAMSGIDPRRRAETLSITEWAELTNSYKSQVISNPVN
jgi:16S rRNA (adenine1518-N6/adenine1519-N6)-dimethyltransferase